MTRVLIVTAAIATVAMGFILWTSLHERWETWIDDRRFRRRHRKRDS